MVSGVINYGVNPNAAVIFFDKICSLFGCSEDYLSGESNNYLPLNFAFRSNGIQTEDLQSIAAVNKIARNICYMNRLIGAE